MVKILCLVPVLPSELTKNCLVSVFSQSVPVEHIHLLGKRGVGSFLPMRISDVLNDGLLGLNLKFFDYLLRIDADTVLPKDFVEKHLALDVDVAGSAGYAQLIKTSFLLDKMNGFFNPLSDDTHIYHKAKACGSASNLVMSVEHRESGVTHSKLQTQFYNGELDYFVGYDPIHVVSWVRLKNFSIIRLLGYFYGLFTFKHAFDFAKSERSKYLSLIFRRIKI